MNRVLLNIVIILCGYSSLSHSEPDSQSVMEGTPPTRDSQATMKNYRDYPFSGWTFQNMGAPLNIVMVPRGGDIAELNQPSNQALGKKMFIDKTGAEMTLEDLFKVHFARGIILIQDDKVLYEKYGVLDLAVRRKNNYHTEAISNIMQTSLNDRSKEVLVLFAENLMNRNY